jgi:hypothetical protein
MKNACLTRVGGVYNFGQQMLRYFLTVTLRGYDANLGNIRRKITGDIFNIIQPGSLIIPLFTVALPLVTGLKAQNMVIDEIFGGGGNNGAPYNRDFVILKNMGSQVEDLSGWSLQYASAAGNFNSITALSGWINPGDMVHVCYYTGANGNPLPFSCDFTSSTNLAAVNGKLALSANSVQVNSQPGSVFPGIGNHADVVDFVGYGNANQYETAAAPAGSAQYGLKRWQESNHNFQDFLPLAPLPADFSFSDIRINEAGEAIIQLELNEYFQENHMDVARSQDGIFFTPVQTVNRTYEQGGSFKIQITDLKPMPGTSYYKITLLNDQQITDYEFIVKCRNHSVSRLPSSVITCREHCFIDTNTETPGDLSIFDMNGFLISQQKDCSKSIVFESSGLAKGTYYMYYSSPEIVKIWMLLIL